MLRHERGIALLATLVVMLLMAGLITVAFSGALTASRTERIDYANSRVFYAAEAGAEASMAQLALALDDGVLTDQELNDIQPPTLTGFRYDSFEVRRVGGIVQETITDGPFAGLYSLTQRVEIFSEARDGVNNASAIIVSAKAQAIPIFQFGIFYEKDLEATNGPDMEFAGWVHSNGNIYLSSNNAWYRDAITTPNKVFHDRKDNHAVNNGVYIDDASANEVPLDFDSRTHPDPDAFRAESDAKFDNRLKTDAYAVDSLRVPLPDGMDPLEVVRPRDADDTDLERRAKFSWKADWYIVVDSDQLISGNALCGAAITATRSTGKVLPATADCNTIFSWSWEPFFEARELKYVDVLQIDVAQLSAWVGGDASRETQVLYVTTTGTTTQNGMTDPSGDGYFPIVRVVNGATLVNPLTVATDRPLYVQGDYNSGAWQPAALVGDAINILSNAWSDANSQCNGYDPPTISPGDVLDDICSGWNKPNAADTDVYAAILAGHSATPCDHEAPGCPGGYEDFYGGGIENYPRFLEKWGNSRTLLYRGSLVTLHESQIATGTWNGRHYTPPRRDWQFDTRFDDPANLPPGTPTVGVVIHTAFRPVY